MFRSPLLFVKDPAVIRQITTGDFDHFADHKLFNTSADDLMAQSLPMLSGDRWRRMRATLSPAFTGSKMRQMFGAISSCAAQMSKTLATQPEESRRSVEMKELFQKYANDVIATAAFGCAVNSFADANNEFMRNGRKLLQSNKVKFLAMSLSPWLARLLGIRLMDTETIEFFRDLVRTTIETREREQITRPDVIDLFMRLRRGEDSTETSTTVDDTPKAAAGIKFSDTEIVSQCFLFFAAGFDTISNALSALAYELALNPDAQQRLHAECAAVSADLRATDSELTYDALQQRCPYLEQCVAESLRLWPPGMFAERMCVRDYAYDDGELRFTLPARTSLWYPIWSLHRDERYWKDASRFDPERWGADRRSEQVSGTYLPFGAGPRNCIGKRYCVLCRPFNQNQFTFNSLFYNSIALCVNGT